MAPVQSKTSGQITRKTRRQTTAPQQWDLLGPESLKAVCTAPGPFITLFLPARHPGAADLSSAERMKTMLRDAERELENRRFQGAITQMLKPLQNFASDPRLHAGGSASVAFVSPGIFRHHRLLEGCAPRLVAASHPHIAPLLAHLLPVHEFSILAIAKKHVRLARWYEGRCEEVPLPAGVPQSFEEFVALNQPDHDLQNRSSAGPAGQVGAARFGTGDERDSLHERLHQYLRRVNHGLSTTLNGAPLVLVGIAEELAVYRAVSDYPRVLEAKPTSPEHLSWNDLAERSLQAVMENRRREATEVLGEFHRTTRRDHVTSGVRRVLDAALQGRVHRLLIEQDAHEMGLLGPLFPVNESRLEGEQDLINAAAVETIRARGEVDVLDPGTLGEAGPIAAILRYS